jgi:hypothetical protein
MDQPSIKALERARRAYRVTFTSSDYARIAAVGPALVLWLRLGATWKNH